MTWLIRLYPSRWRDRYGAELEQLVRDLRPSVSPGSLAVDLIRGALDAHIQQGFDMSRADRTAVKRGALIATVAWLGLSVEIVLTNVVFPSTGDSDTIPVLLSYLCVFAALGLIGALAARNGAEPRGLALAGLVAGMMIGALTVATFAAVDNVWLDIVARQRTKIDGFAHSGAGSMREYLNNSLIGPAFFLTLVLGAAGVLLSLIGGFFARPSGAPWTTTVDRTRR